MSGLPFPRPRFDAELAFQAIAEKSLEVTHLQAIHADAKKAASEARERADAAAHELTAMIRDYQADRDAQIEDGYAQA